MPCPRWPSYSKTTATDRRSYAGSSWKRPDRAGLLAAWLDELVYLADAEGFVPEALVELELEGQRLEAAVRGYLGNPRPLVKAVTHHNLAFGEEGGRWYAQAVLDV
jgi:SHS2 domain-containing protein